MSPGIFSFGYGTDGGYGYGGSGSAVSPPSISYAGSPFSWTYGSAIAAASVTNSGGAATSYAVTAGALPTGVSLNTTTGELTGTPTTAKVIANVTITATNAGGTSAAVISVVVPSPLYTSLSEVWDLGDADGAARVGSHAGLNLTNNNNVLRSVAGGPDGGNASIFVAASSQNLSRAANDAFRLGTADFCVGVWVKPTAFTAECAIIDFLVSGGVGSRNDAFVLVSNATTGRLRIYTAGAYSAATTGALTINVWNYVEIQRVGTTLTFYIKGTADATTVTLSTDITSGGLVVGA